MKSLSNNNSIIKIYIISYNTLNKFLAPVHPKKIYLENSIIYFMIKVVINLEIL